MAKDETAVPPLNFYRRSCSEFLRFCRVRASSELLIRGILLGISVIALRGETDFSANSSVCQSLGRVTRLIVSIVRDVPDIVISVVTWHVARSDVILV